MMITKIKLDFNDGITNENSLKNTACVFTLLNVEHATLKADRFFNEVESTYNNELYFIDVKTRHDIA